MKSRSITAVFFVLFILSGLYAQDKMSFKELSSMNDGRYGMGYATDGNNIYAASGGMGGAQTLADDIEVYNIATNTWTVASSGIMPRRYCNAEYLPSQHKLYLFNGEYITSAMKALTPRVDVYDVLTKDLTIGTDNPYPVKNAGSAMWNDKIYFFGGEDANGPTDRFYEYDPAAGTWKRLNNMLSAKQTTGKIVDGVLYIFGGFNGSNMLRTIEAYDFKTETWKEIGKILRRISASASAADGRYIWLAGSYEKLGYLASYDTKTAEYKEYNSDMTRRRWAGAVIVKETLFIFGGNQSPRAISTLSNTECANISLNSK